MVHEIDVAVSENKMTSGSGNITKLGMDKKLSADIVRLANRIIGFAILRVSDHVGLFS